MDVTKILELSKKKLKRAYKYCQMIPQSGSERIYIRLFYEDEKLIGVYNPNVKENRAFLKLSKIFLKAGLPVPKVFAIDLSEQYYIITDHGSKTLYDYIKNREETELSLELYNFYEQTVNYLIDFQLCGHQKNFYKNCNHPKKFDKCSVIWDLNYFKYDFLKLTGVQFDEYLLEKDFNRLAGKIAVIPLQGFMYRDFQSRNIMIDNEKPVFIDFQGGRKGPLQYDIISLLWQARAKLSHNDRNNLLEHYLKLLETKLPKSRELFMLDFNMVLILRLIQVLGAYGFRGLVERKSIFLTNVYYGSLQLSQFWDEFNFDREYPELGRCIKQIGDMAELFAPKSNCELIVNITSFSFLRGGYPVNNSGHGGGHVFDCRGLPNPGRCDDLKQLTGLDTEVIKFFSKEDTVDDFINSCYKIIFEHAKKYVEIGYNNLYVSFGYTGGKHRSVYCASIINKMLNEAGIKTTITHREQKQLN